MDIRVYLKPGFFEKKASTQRIYKGYLHRLLTQSNRENWFKHGTNLAWNVYMMIKNKEFDNAQLLRPISLYSYLQIVYELRDYDLLTYQQHLEIAHFRQLLLNHQQQTQHVDPPVKEDGTPFQLKDLHAKFASRWYEEYSRLNPIFRRSKDEDPHLFDPNNNKDVFLLPQVKAFCSFNDFTRNVLLGMLSCEFPFRDDIGSMAFIRQGKMLWQRCDHGAHLMNALNRKIQHTGYAVRNYCFYDLATRRLFIVLVSTKTIPSRYPPMLLRCSEVVSDIFYKYWLIISDDPLSPLKISDNDPRCQLLHETCTTYLGNLWDKPDDPKWNNRPIPYRLGSGLQLGSPDPSDSTYDVYVRILALSPPHQMEFSLTGCFLTLTEPLVFTSNNMQRHANRLFHPTRILVSIKDYEHHDRLRITWYKLKHKKLECARKLDQTLAELKDKARTNKMVPNAFKVVVEGDKWKQFNINTLRRMHRTEAVASGRFRRIQQNAKLSAHSIQTAQNYNMFYNT